MKLAIIDKDGTLTSPLSGEGFVQHPRDQKLLPGVEKALRKLIDQGYQIAIASNQGGVAAGHKTLESAIQEMQYCLRLLPQYMSVLVYFCPDFEGKQCYSGDWRGFESVGWLRQIDSFRKPGAGMLQLAMAQHCVEPQDCLMIGDRLEDQQSAAAAGIEFLQAELWRNPTL